MQESQQYINLHQGFSAVDVKTENFSESPTLSLLSPPSSPSSPKSVSTFPSTSPWTSTRRRYTSIVPYPKKARITHSSSARDICRFDPRKDGLRRMTHPSYGSWSTSGIKNEESQGSQIGTAGPARRSSSSDGDQQYASYPMSYPQQSTYLRRPAQRTDGRPHSSSSITSSLTGAMGQTHISPSGNSGSPSPTDFSFTIDAPMQPSMVWAPGPGSQTQGPIAHGAYNVHDQASLPLHSISTTPASLANATNPYIQYQDYNVSAYPNIPPQSHSPDSPILTRHPYPSQLAYPPAQNRRPQSSMQAAQMMGSGAIDTYGAITSTSRSAHPIREPLEQEVQRLRERVRDLETINNSTQARVRDLQMELASQAVVYGQQSTSALGGLPSPLSTPVTSSSFQASWNARTDARVRIFCSLNRAGNALCAWHDSRRERRAYPPRIAPAGHLNCGCTYEEALFEESLARHGVGSYHPGESVRMDPALRNPLLKLLQQRYGYRDGDFERDPVTGGWIEGEGHQVWEEKAMAGISASRKNRGEERR